MSTRSAEGMIGPQLVVRGRVIGKGDLRVDGTVEGDLDIDGALAVGAEGTIVGPARAAEIEVAGEIHGKVEAREGLSIRAGGLVQGDARARRIAIDDGAALHGTIDMEFEIEDEVPR